MKILRCCWMVLFVSCAVTAELRGQVKAVPSQQAALTSKDSITDVATAGMAAFLMPVVVDPSSTGSDSLDIVYSQSGVLISLILPTGTEVNAANASTFGYQFSTMTVQPGDSLSLLPFDAVGTHTNIVFPMGAAAGTYRVKVNTTGVSGDTLVTISYQSSSSLKSGLITDGTSYKTGTTIKFSGILFDGSNPVAGANILVMVGDKNHPENDPVQVTLLDSGPADNAVGDGIYTGVVTLSTPGQYIAAMKATGVSASGKPYSRFSSASFTVIGNWASFTSFSDRSVDDNANGRPDRVEVLANINVQRAGNYFLTLYLVSNSGGKVISKQRTSLLTGQRQMAASFTVDELKQLNGDGPYNITDVTLYFEDDPGLPTVDYRASAGTTQAYVLSTFERDPLLFPGPNTVATVDGNGNGKFDQLIINATVDVLNTGSYYWAAALLDSTGEEIDYSSTADATTLASGQRVITFYFSGQEISRSQKNGPYTIGNVDIWGDAEAKLDFLMTTPAYSYTQFDPPIMMNCPTINVSAPAGRSSTVVNYALPAVSGNVSSVAVSCLPAPGSVFNVGMTTVNCSALESVTNYTATCSFPLTVTAGADTTPPVIVCPTIAYAVIPYGQSSGPAFFPAPTVTDNTGVASFTCTPASGATLSRGVTTVTCTATDTAGNQASCSFTLRVFDVSLQDNQSNHTLWFDSITGDYLFFSCDTSGYTLAGRGTITRVGCEVRLGGDPRVSATFVACVSTPSVRYGNAVIKPNPIGGWFYITDSNANDNSLSCPRG